MGDIDSLCMCLMWTVENSSVAPAMGLSLSPRQCVPVTLGSNLWATRQTGNATTTPPTPPSSQEEGGLGIPYSHYQAAWRRLPCCALGSRQFGMHAIWTCACLLPQPCLLCCGGMFLLLSISPSLLPPMPPYLLLLLFTLYPSFLSIRHDFPFPGLQ